MKVGFHENTTYFRVSMLLMVFFWFRMGAEVFQLFIYSL